MQRPPRAAFVIMGVIMSISVKFYNFTKNENSTARPSGSAAYDGTCVIRKDCSIINPQIELDYDPDNGSTWFNYNYCYIANFHRYYYVRDWTISDSFIIATLEVDVLATYKTQIGNSTLFVIRSSAEIDGGIIDSFYPTNVGTTFDADLKSNKWRVSGNGFYVVGVVSKNGGMGSIEYYAFSPTNMQTFVANLLNDSITNGNGFSWDDASQALQKSIIDPLQFIKSCVYIPRAYSDLTGTTVSSVDVFDWTIQCSAKIPDHVDYNIETSFTRPTHPQSPNYPYLRLSPYSIYTLYIPPFGVIELDSTVLAMSANVVTRIIIDIATGEGTLEIYAGDLPGSGTGAYLLNVVLAQVVVPIQLS